MSRSTAGLALCVLALLSACQRTAEAPAPEIRPVRAMTIDKRATSGTVALTGTVQAQTEINQSFRIDGRLVERTVDIGDNVKPGQLIARLDPQNEESGLQSARAQLAGANAQLVEARSNYNRMAELVVEDAVSRAQYEQAKALLQSAEAQVQSVQGQLNLSQNRLSYTRLFSDVAGVVTARGPQPGEVVSAGRMIIQVAREGARDAVFDVPAQIKDSAPLDPRSRSPRQGGHAGGARAGDRRHAGHQPEVTAKGRVREVSPRADPVTGTFAVRVRLIDPPRGHAPGQHRHRAHPARCRQRHHHSGRGAGARRRQDGGVGVRCQDRHRVAAQHRGARFRCDDGAGGLGPEPR